MQNTVKRVSILVAALLPVVVLGFFVMKPKEQAQPVTSSVVVTTPATTTSVKPTTGTTTTPSTPVPTPSTTPAPAPASTSTYKDGTYSVTTTYRVPEAPAQGMGVELTLVNDVITAATVTAKATDGTSMMYQNIFIAGYKTFVVGKNIADVQLTKVSGSSLTPKGFNDALNAIKTQAQA
ncbi:MAG: hypothetical protein AAB473_05345 [Patescibacteria group bacterium]